MNHESASKTIQRLLWLKLIQQNTVETNQIKMPWHPVIPCCPTSGTLQINSKKLVRLPRWKELW